jgi:hypothetical protein
MALPAGARARLAVPRTPQQGNRVFSNDRIKSLTKQQIQRYIESFFLRLGHNNDLLGIVSPRALSYNIDRSFDDKVDPTQRKMQIVRYFNELRNIVPAVIVMDSGVHPAPQSIGQISKAYIQGNQWYGYYPIFRKVPITLLVAARDYDTVDDLSSLISLMFNELRNLAGGSFIRGSFDQGETWVVTLPNEGVEVGPTVEIAVEGDPLEKILYTESSFDVYYEDVIGVQQQLPTIAPGNPAITLDAPNLKNTLPPIITCPDTVSINSQIVVFIQNLSHRQSVQVSDPTVATISQSYILTPRNFGTVSIQVYDPTVTDASLRVVASKAVQITR